jgi:hypothetical protein
MEAPEPTAPTEEEVEEPATVAAAPAFHAAVPGAATEATDSLSSAIPALDSTPPAGQQVTKIVAVKNPPQFIIEMTESSSGQ